MRLFIGGLPNSGTTHVAHVLKEAGVDFGDDVWPHALHRKGMEWLPLRTWYLAMFDEFMGGPDPTSAIFDITDVQRDAYYRANPLPADAPPSVKIPDFGVHRLDQRWPADTTIRVVRPKTGWVRSMVQWRALDGEESFLSDVYDHVTSLWQGDIDVEWPRVIHDVDYLEDVLGDFGDVAAACRRVTRSEWVTF